MKLSNEKLVNSIGVLNKLNNAELPVRLSYKFARNIKEIDDTLKVFNDEKQKLINKYSEKDEQGANKIDEQGTVKIMDPLGWNKDYKELLDIEVEAKIDKINIDEFSKTDIKITPAELMLIDYLIK